LGYYLDWMDGLEMVAARHLTREERHILNLAMRDSLKIIEAEGPGCMQDGILAHYLGQAGASDANVEARLEKEPFDFRKLSR
jgi:hypothetical protein